MGALFSLSVLFWAVPFLVDLLNIWTWGRGLVAWSELPSEFY